MIISLSADTDGPATVAIFLFIARLHYDIAFSPLVADCQPHAVHFASRQPPADISLLIDTPCFALPFAVMPLLAFRLSPCCR